MSRAGLLALVLAGTVATGAAGQADTTRRDSTARDTTRATRDTSTVLLPALPRAIASGPLPLGSRYVFTTDSLLLREVRTLSDLLAHVPGVYVARGGWYGQAEPVIYGGRGPLALEIYWDGVPYLPIGRDSVYLDPARITLAPLERVDVVVLPGSLRVFLVTTRPRSTAAGTQIGVATGDADIAGYRAGYAARTRAGLGLSVLADWNHLRGSGFAGITTFNNTDYWLKAEYAPPSGRVGASFQILSSSWDRDGATGTVNAWRMLRRDEGLRVFAATRADGLGARIAASIGNTIAERDTTLARRSFWQATLEATQTWPRANVTLAGRFGFRGAPTDLEARAALNPVPRVTLAASLRRLTYAGNRSGNRAHVTAGVVLPLGLSLRGEAAWVRDVQAPFDTSDATQTAADLAAWVRLERSWALVEVGRGRRDPFAPLGFAKGIRPVAQLDSTPQTDFVAARATLRPLPGVELSGWYFDPVTGGGSFEPPHHARLSAAFYSKFWRVFPSGAFALRGELSVESWSRWGLAGRDSSGAPRALGGATFANTNLEMQLVGVTFFWIVQNVYAMRSGYVPGLSYPKSVQMYGARWYFSN